MRKYRKPYRVKKKKSIFRNRFFWLGILILIIFGGFFYLICFSSFFQIEKVIITGEEKVSTEDLKLLIEKKLENKILFFKTKSIFLVNLSKIKKDILNNFPKAAKVEISREFPDALRIIVVERFGIATWCQKDRCFLLDKEGIIFEEGMGVNLIKMVDEKNPTLSNLGEKVIEKDYLEEILEAQRKFRGELKVESQEFIVFSNRFNAKTQEGWEIYFSPKEDLDWQLTKLKVVLEEEIPPENRRNLEYIELRFGNFAPYRYR